MLLGVQLCLTCGSANSDPVLLLQARNSMISKAAVESAAEAAAPGSKEGAWKWAVRKQVRAASWPAQGAHDKRGLSGTVCAFPHPLWRLSTTLTSLVVPAQEGHVLWKAGQAALESL